MELISIIKKWTLPVAIAMGAVVYLLFAFIPLLSPAAEVFEPIFGFLLPICMFLMLYVTFCKVNFRKLIPVQSVDRRVSGVVCVHCSRFHTLL